MTVKLIISAILFCHTIYATDSQFFSADSASELEYDYGFSIDAGSTGSRIYAYRWAPRTTRNANAPESKPQQYGEKMKTDPVSGITSLADAETLLGALIDHVKNLTYSEHSRWNTFPIYLKATAGMRLLDTTDRNSIFAWIREVFADVSINPFLFQDSYSIIASGTEEATFDWLGVNYLKDTLELDAGAMTYGALDLGGASTQIAFAPIPSSDIIDSFLMTQPFGYPFRLYAMSHLGYGAKEIERQVAEKAYAENNNRNPCYNTGLNRTLDFIRNRTDNGGTIENVRQVGTGDSALCEQYLQAVLYLDQPNCVFFGQGEECSVNGVYIPTLPTDMDWVAFSAFAYTVLADEHGITETSTLAEIYDFASNTLCGYSWDKLNAELPGLWQDSGETLCLLNLYVVVLLRDGYHFDVNKRNILWTNDIDDSEVGWQWGSILQDANALGYDYICNGTNTTDSGTDNGNDANGLQKGKFLAIFIFLCLFYSPL